MYCKRRDTGQNDTREYDVKARQFAGERNLVTDENGCRGKACCSQEEGFHFDVSYLDDPILAKGLATIIAI